MIGVTLREAGGYIILTAAVLTAAGVIWRWARMVIRWAHQLGTNLNQLPAIRRELTELRELTARNGKPPGGPDGGAH